MECRLMLPRGTGEGDRAQRGGGGFGGEDLLLTLQPPPPCFAWSPCPAFAGEDGTLITSADAGARSAKATSR